jgi:probable F420-dependent oxidoreductase
VNDDWRQRLGRFGFWTSRRLFPTDDAQLRDVMAELDSMPIGALWLGSSPPADLEGVERMLAAGERIVIGTSIVNIWFADPAELAPSRARIEAAHPDRLMIGLGIGHAGAVEASGQTYAHPYSRMVRYLDELDEGDPPLPAEGRMIAALGPRTLALAAERAAGAIPYLVTPEHTARAREILGSDALLVPEQKVLLTTDADVARAHIRKFMTNYMTMPNYVNTWRTLGFTEDDFAGAGSDRLVDALVLHGTIDEVMVGLQAHLDAGADQVAVQPLPDGDGVPLEAWRVLAEAFSG